MIVKIPKDVKLVLRIGSIPSHMCDLLPPLLAMLGLIGTEPCRSQKWKEKILLNQTK